MTLLTKEEEDVLLQCSDFYNLLDRALTQLEQDDYYGLTMQLRDLHSILLKLVTVARADIYSTRLKAINERLDKHGDA